MGYHVVDMSADPRCGQFAYFRRMTFPFAGITAEVDITDLMAARNGRPFFLSMLYAVTRAVNAVPQLRRRITEDGAVVEYDWCAPSYTAMKPDGVYVYCTVEGDLPYDEFVRLGQSRQREVLERGTLTEDGDIRGMIFVSSVPWLHYTQLQHPAESPDDSNPRISWGKYVTVNGRTTLPVSLFVNHALADGLPLVLGGIEIPHTKGFVAHSDGDVAIHAVCDALLGAAALGDIGMHFPDTSDDFKGIDSKILLRRVAALLREKGYEIGNVDCTIRMQRPKLRPHIDAMRTAMAGAMGVGDDRVSVKATTTEHLGFEGREEGVSVSAVALIYKMQAKPGEETVG